MTQFRKCFKTFLNPADFHKDIGNENGNVNVNENGNENLNENGNGNLNENGNGNLNAKSLNVTHKISYDTFWSFIR